MNGTMTDTFTIWDIDDDGKKAVVRMSTGRKVKEDETSLIEHGIAKNGYVNTSWSFVQFVGKAYNQLKKYELKSGDKITKVNMQIKQEPYWASGEEMVLYPKTPKYTVFDFELPEARPTSNVDKGPVVETKQSKKTVAPSKSEYPF